MALGAGILRCDDRWVIQAANGHALELLQIQDVVGMSFAETPLGKALLARDPRGYPFSRYVEAAATAGARRGFVANVARSAADRIVTFEPVARSLATLSQFDVVVLATDEVGRVIFMHQGDPRLPEIAPELAVGRRVTDANDAFTPWSGLAPGLIAAVMAGTPKREHYEIALPDGAAHALNVRLMPWRYCGCSCGVLIIVSDVTDIADAAVEDARAVMYSVWNTLQHELRNPLQTMQAALAVLAPHVGEPGLSSLRLLGEQIQTITAYLSEQLLAGLPEPGPMARGHLSAVIRREIERAAGRLSTRGLTIAHHPLPGADEPQVRMRAESVGRVFANLLRSIARARPDARIEIGYTVRDGCLVCRLAHDGPGIPATLLQTDWLRQDEPASHLGLALAASTLQAHGGSIAWGSREGGGAFVEIAIPVAPCAPEAG